MRRIASLAVLLPLAVVAAPARAAPFPDGATVAGVPVGGLEPADAREAVRRQLAPVYERPVVVRVRHRRRNVGTKWLGQTVRYDRMIAAAVQQASRGGPVSVVLMRTISRRRLTWAIAALARPWYRPPRNARAILGIRRIARIRARWGRALATRRLRRAIVHELWRPTRRRVVQGRLLRLRPRITGRVLRRIYGTYISVDRRRRLLRLFKHLRHVRTYRVAVGRAGYDTPAGLHHVLYKERNPAWHVPRRAWAGALAGRTIPPGDPRNPLKARFIALGNGVGIHGTSDLASIGRAASHGCIRMRIPDVIRLYRRTPVGTPVRIR